MKVIAFSISVIVLSPHFLFASTDLTSKVLIYDQDLSEDRPDDSKFTPNNTTEINRSYSNNFLWLKINIKKLDIGKYLVFSSPLIDEITELNQSSPLIKKVPIK